ncbi:MAG: hypothetical protein HRT74_01730 [Flavobacteriales bacterium]|nr:hypothetical protein [Flavobacteriales bacterium]
MKYIAYLLLVTLVGVLFTSCGSSQKENQTELESKIFVLEDKLKRYEEIHRDSKKRNLLLESELQELYKGVAELETVSPEGMSAEEVLQLVEVKNEKISEVQQRISALNSGVQSLKVTISQLEDDLENEAQLNAFLVKDMDQYELFLTESNDEKQELMIQNGLLTSSLNQKWLLLGEKEELVDKDIIEWKGGFLGMGGRPVLSKSDLPVGVLTQLSGAQQTRIHIPGNKVQFASHHPEGSYKIQQIEDHLELTITDPSKFWRTSKLLALIY